MREEDQGEYLEVDVHRRLASCCILGDLQQCLEVNQGLLRNNPHRAVDCREGGDEGEDRQSETRPREVAAHSSEKVTSVEEEH